MKYPPHIYYEGDYIALLHKFTVPRLIELHLHNKFHSESKYHIETIPKYLNRLQRSLDTMKDCYKSHDEIAIPIDKSYKDKYSDIAEDAASYFKQAYQLLSASTQTLDESRPIIEYYGLLQLVKGVFSTMFDLKETKLFSGHGLYNKWDSKNYMVTAYQKYGTLQALALISNSDKIIKEMLVTHPDYNFLRIFSHVNFIKINHENMIWYYIGCWMMSSIARYKPKQWQEIIDGRNEVVIVNIREFWKHGIKSLVNFLLSYFDLYQFKERMIFLEND